MIIMKLCYGKQKDLDSRNGFYRGTMNICIDSGMASVDLPEERFILNSVIFHRNKDEILSIERPDRRLHLDMEKGHLWYYDTFELKWKTVKYEGSSDSNES